MSTTLNVQTAEFRDAPRGAVSLGTLFAVALKSVSRLFAKRAGPTRRQTEIDAQEVRALAYSMASTYPGVASDLLAAVDRHEARLGL